MGVDGKSVRSSSGAEVKVWEPLRRPIDFDCVVVIGGLVEGHRAIDRRILEYLREAHKTGCLVVGLCTGSFALAYAGLMDDRTTCVHWFHKPDFQRAFPKLRCVTDTVFYEDGNCLTCAGGGVAGDVAAHLIERFCGPARAQIGASGMLMESVKGIRAPQPHLEAEWFQRIPDADLRRCILTMDQNIRRPLTIKELAGKARLSKYRLERLFKSQLGVSAASFFRSLRLAHANKAVLYSRRQLTDIAAEFGFSDASHFSKCFLDMFGISPSKVRNLGLDDAVMALSSASEEQPVVVASLLQGHLFFSSQMDGAAQSVKNTLTSEMASKA
jgi:transcriptional regulator GlxA family with amidase domain